MHILDKSIFENSYPKLLWIEDLPEDWTIARLHQVADLRPSNVDKKSQEDEDEVQLCNYTDVYYNDFITRDIDFSYATAPQRQIERFELKAGDVVITKDSEDWEDIGVPAYVPQDLDNVICGYHLFLIRPMQMITGHYLFWCIKSTETAYQFSVEASGITRYGLSQQSAKYVVLPIPPIEEQKAIASYLDEETARIDALITEFQEMLGELAEKRSAIISHAMRSGIEGAKTKSVDLTFANKIPIHWEIVQLKLVAGSIQTGPFGTQLHSNEYVQDAIPVINPSHIIDGVLIPDSRITINQETADRLSRHKLEEGDIVVGRRGEMGRAGIVTKRQVGWICGTGSLRVRPKLNLVSPRYLNVYISLRGVAELLELHSVGSTLSNLNTQILGNLPVLLPPLEEQNRIVDYIEHQNHQVYQLVKQIKHNIELLQERRIALISAAVTGKIRVTQ